MRETSVNTEKKTDNTTSTTERVTKKGSESGSRSGDSRGRGGFRGKRRGNVVDLKKRVQRFDTEKTTWVPKTEIGKKVANGEIKSIDEILEKNIRIKEPEIIEKLLPNLREEILENKRVQRVTMNGRVMRFKVVMAVGDGEGILV